MNTDKIYAEQLANEYAPKDTSKVVALRKLDIKAKRPANIFTYSFGIISALVFGTGMCLAMGQIGSATAGSFVRGNCRRNYRSCRNLHLNFIKDSQRLFGTCLENATVLGLDKSYAALLSNVIVPILDRYGVPSEKYNYIMAFYISGLIAVIND